MYKLTLFSTITSVNAFLLKDAKLTIVVYIILAVIDERGNVFRWNVWIPILCQLPNMQLSSEKGLLHFLSCRTSSPSFSHHTFHHIPTNHWLFVQSVTSTEKAKRANMASLHPTNYAVKTQATKQGGNTLGHIARDMVRKRPRCLTYSLPYILFSRKINSRLEDMFDSRN